jgi:hypothetical protein
MDEIDVWRLEKRAARQGEAVDELRGREEPA